MRGIVENSDVRRFDWRSVVSGEGIFSTHGVIDIGTTHLVVGRRNVYEYNGGFELTPIGDKIQPQLLDRNSRMEEGLRGKLFWIFDEIENRAKIMYADALAAAYPNRMFDFDISSREWTERIFGASPGQEYTGWGETVDTNVLTWDDLVGSWLEQDFKWGGSSASTDRPTILLCGKASTNTYEYSDITADDNGTAITGTIETGDFRSPGIESRFDWFDLVAAGTNIEVLYSINKGVSWISLGTQTFSADILKKRFYKQFIFDTIRYRLESSTYMRIIRYTFKSSLESE